MHILTRDEVEDVQLRWWDAKKLPEVQKAPILREFGDALVAWLLFGYDADAGGFPVPGPKEFASHAARLRVVDGAERTVSVVEVEADEHRDFTESCARNMMARLRALGVLPDYEAEQGRSAA